MLRKEIDGGRLVGWFTPTLAAYASLYETVLVGEGPRLLVVRDVLLTDDSLAAKVVEDLLDEAQRLGATRVEINGDANLKEACDSKQGEIAKVVYHFQLD
jgi:hypothetical protein